MQLTIVALLSLVAVAFAAPVELSARANTLPTEASVMTDAQGNVVAFNSAGVYQAATAAGQ